MAWLIATEYVTEDEVRPAAFAFRQAHEECRTMAHTERVERSLVCWCERCKDLRAYEIDGGRGSLPAA